MPLLEVKSVSKRFRHSPALGNLLGRERTGHTLALDQVSFEVEQGEIIGVLGPNGSGKTTLFKIIAGMLLPDSGSIHISSRERQSVAAGAVGMAIASERSFFPRLTAYENLDYFAALENISRGDRPSRVSHVLEVVGLSSQSDVLAQKFSSGMYQRLAIARALLREPRLLLLDEPTRSLDPAAAESLWQWIRESAAAHVTVLIATHNFIEASATASRAVILAEGRLVSSSLITSPDELRHTYFEIATQESLDAHAAAAAIQR
jgi:ABC-2 type transport system ATP-binding protein